MASEKITLMAKANKLGLEGYRKLSIEELRTAVATAEGTGTPTKGKGKTSSTNGASSATGSKGKTAATTTAAKGKGKTSSSAKRAPAKSTARKATPAKGKAAQGTAKRPATGGKGKTTTAKPKAASSRKQAVGRVEIDNSKINWKAESNVGRTGKRKEVLDSLRKHKGDKLKVWEHIGHRAKAFYPGKSKDEAEQLLVWLIGRVAYDFVFKTGQHTPGSRAAYGTSEAAQDVRRRQQRAAARPKTRAKAPSRKAAGASQSRGKGKTAAGKGKGKSGR